MVKQTFLWANWLLLQILHKLSWWVRPIILYGVKFPECLSKLWVLALFSNLVSGLVFKYLWNFYVINHEKNPNLSLNDVSITTDFQVQVLLGSAELPVSSKFQQVSWYCLFSQYTLFCLAQVETRLAKQRKSKTRWHGVTDVKQNDV